MRSVRTMPLSFDRWRGIVGPWWSPPAATAAGTASSDVPVKGESAIVVVTDGEIRLKEGSYIAEAKKLNLEFKPDPGDDKFVIEESGFKVDQEKQKEEKRTPASTDTPALQKPKGFL